MSEELTMHTIEKWKDKKTIQPKGECICAGCSSRLKKRKYSTTHFEHLADVEQPYKYCRMCLRAGHDLVFPRSYEMIERPGKSARAGKRLPMTNEQRAQGFEVQRGMHG